MYSEGEQTAAIHARVTIGGVSYNVIVTHLGNGGPLVQQENVLAETRGLENVILMGDFNFRPDTEQYARTVEIFADSWLLRWPEGKDDQGVDPVDRIDHIFLSPGLNVLEARYIHSPVSDHPAYWIELEPAALSAAMPADLPAALPAAQLAR
jgi:endonuclease/exonuclease/phosphatase family metal-dependent hydrolase